MKPLSRYRKHHRRDGQRTIRKSVSCEPLLDMSSSDEEDRTGGARLTRRSLTPSPAGKRLFAKRSASEAARSRPGSADSFQVGANHDDDVFAEDDDDSASVSGARTSEEDPSTSHMGQLPGDKIPSVDAQGIYPPTACIFAANLAQLYDDKTLEYEVTRTFSKYGPVFVKIRRDARHMPFAFCQFTCDEHAKEAKERGCNAYILGRQCRTEMAKAHTTFMVYKHSGDSVTVDEATNLMSSLGEVAEAEQLAADMQRSMRLPPTIVVRYKMYDPRRDVPGTFRGDRKYKVIPYDPRPSGNAKPDPQGSPNRAQFLHQYDRDRRSVYMGNLPMNMTEEILRNLVGACGEIASVVLFKKPVPGSPSKMTCFAFIEFSRPDTADDAIKTFNNTDINGFRVRVDRKQSRTFETPRRQIPMRSTQYSHSTFPRRRHAPVMAPVSPLHTMFDPPAGPSKPSSHHSSPIDSEQTPRTAVEAAQTISGESNLFTPTPKRSYGNGNGGFAYGNMETPMAMQQQHAPMPMGWMPPFPPYPYGPPMSPYGPMTPHGTPGVMYPGYNPGPYYPGMYDMYPMASPPHMMAPPPQIQPAPAPPVRAEAPAEAQPASGGQDTKEEK
ncbi:RNA-binding protein [Cordyceps fumosorosea ARSEF 2679]|uniref:RNA-binding protein n=1 Tax=Cordyceps fumosorosea (strain ARSEF 2679) TaxID=1081104 RepID=A0A167T1A7_CORFA|nr:RNA-binding protein [Cordyceps fumosorosea ARSEF 2679]OAA60144.1 RNA-binding protein [Cordyceps fumosorosea ARSEF 2679]